MRNDYDELHCLVLCHPDIELKKANKILTILGFPGRLYYKPTMSPIEHITETYDKPSLNTVIAICEKGLCDHVPCIKHDVNGNVMVEMYRSKNYDFVALQANQYSDFSYSPVTSPRIFVGEPAIDVIRGLLEE